MSRVGKQPIPVPAGVKVAAEGRLVNVEGPRGKMNMSLEPGIELEQRDGELVLTQLREDRQGPAMWGLGRALLANCVKGVSEGFRRRLEIQGTGYRASMEGKDLVLLLGFSHPVKYAVPPGIEIKVESPTRVQVEGIDKALVGQVAAEIRAFRPPEPYKGKGVRYEGEQVRRKAGKSAAGGAG